MNKYKITTFSYGQSQAFIVEASDMVQALQGGMVNQSEVVKIEFMDSAEITDLT
tara:strand:+ start:544 stop:705 length:162 start_codon:yes stop_codon:yes gene_type:complete